MPLSAGLVGFTGVAAGSLTAKGQRHIQLALHGQDLAHDELTELRTERRKVYATYLVAVYETTDDCKTLVRLLPAYLELQLVAGPGVLHHALEVSRAVENALKLSADPRQIALNELTSALLDLLKEMRRELTIARFGDESAMSDDKLSEAGIRRAIERRLSPIEEEPS